MYRSLETSDFSRLIMTWRLMRKLFRSEAFNVARDHTEFNSRDDSWAIAMKTEQALSVD